MNIRILVATHKAYRMPADPMYLPLHVGKEGKTIELGFTCDNTGDNISAKNATFCELTGIYWAWKNLDADYIGLCHYRRYFAMHRPKHGSDFWDAILTQAEAEQLLGNCPVIVPKKRNYYIETVYNQYIHAHPAEPLDLALKLAAVQSDAYAAAVKRMKKRTATHIFNMFIMRKDLFDHYCQWLFDLLFQVEAQIDISDYSTYDHRVFGFLSERLLDVWLDAGGISYQELPVISMEPQNWLKKGSAFLMRKLSGGKH